MTKKEILEALKTAGPFSQEDLKEAGIDYHFAFATPAQRIMTIELSSTNFEVAIRDVGDADGSLVYEEIYTPPYKENEFGIKGDYWQPVEHQ